MRCQKCGKFNWWYPKFCRKCGAEFARKKKHRRLLWIIISIVFVLLAGIVFLAISLDKQFNDAVAGIQSNLAEIAIAKKGGDFIMAGKKTGATMDSIQTTAITTAKNLAELSVPDELKNYQGAAILWSIKIAVATGNKNDWKNLKNQPDDFPLIISEAKAYNLFKPLVQTMAEFKKSGADAIQKKDREAMLRISAKLIIGGHWLNAILHSRSDTVAFKLTAPVFAASPSGLQPVPSVKGMDVTCMVCNYPEAYKVKWTDKLRQQYGCEVRCHLAKATEDETATEEQSTVIDEAAKYAEASANYSYDNVSKRSICIGTGGTSAGNETTRKYCVEDVIQSTNEIAASAISFVEWSKELTIDQWNRGYEDVDLALGIINEAPVQATAPTGQVGAPPNKPSAEGGHKEGGQGTVQQGKPIAAPEPTQKKGGIWDGYYKLSGNCTEVCTSGVCSLGEALGGEKQGATKHYSANESFYVLNNKITRYNEEVVAPGVINANGYAKIITFTDGSGYEQFQFTRTSSSNSVKMDTHLNIVGLVTDCTYSGNWVSADYPDDY